MAIHDKIINVQFHEIPSMSNLVMAEDGRMGGMTKDGGTD